MVRPTDVTRFWLEELSPADWYRQSDELDQQIRDTFQETWTAISKKSCESPALEEWFASPEAMLGLVILLDQFPRNMFREDPRAFSTDKRARAVSKKAIEKRWDVRVPCPGRQFFYMPLMHSECLMDQDRAVRLLATRMEDGAGNLLHARVHREIIRKFGRFPYRNTALSRKTTEAEAKFLEEGGYKSILDELQSRTEAA